MLSPKSIIPSPDPDTLWTSTVLNSPHDFDIDVVVVNEGGFVLLGDTIGLCEINKNKVKFYKQLRLFHIFHHY